MTWITLLSRIDPDAGQLYCGREPILGAISELRKELRRINQAIRMLESLANNKPRRGRPPKFLAEVMASRPETRKRRRLADPGPAGREPKSTHPAHVQRHQFPQPRMKLDSRAVEWGGMYSERLLEHFQNPRNAGKLETPDIQVEVSNPICGDILRLEAKVEAGRIAVIRYLTRGCTASIAVGSALTTLLEGKTGSEAASITREMIEDSVGGLSNESKHAAVLALDGVKALLKKMDSLPA